MSIVHKIEFEKDKMIDKSLKKVNTNMKKNNIYFFRGKFLFVEKWAFNVFVDWQVRLRETNYQQVIFDKSFCGELQKIADYIIFNNLLY